MLDAARRIGQRPVSFGAGRFEGLADGPVKPVRAGGSVDGAQPHHPPSSNDAPALPCALHADLKDMAVGALDDARADGNPHRSEDSVPHALLVVAVVPDDVVEGDNVN